MQQLPAPHRLPDQFDTENFVAGFRALGIASYVVKDDKEAESVLKKLQSSQDNIILISEDLAIKVEGRIREITESTKKSILALPGLEGERGFARNSLRMLAERAAGTDIFEE